MDPRLEVIDRRLKGIKKIVAVSGGKGGIGKSSVSSMIALTLAESGKKVGLLDLDFSSPSTHVILGIKGLYPIEEKGIIPPEIYGMKYMSIIYYVGDNPSPLRGVDISNAIIELLAITRWEELDYLIIDMPPGIGDIVLDTIRLMKRIEFLVLTTRSKITFETVKKVLTILQELHVPIMGVVENMKRADDAIVKDQIAPWNVPLLEGISYDEDMEEALGSREKLLETVFAKDIKKIIESKAFEIE